MSFQNQDKVLIRSIRSKRAVQKIYLPIYIAAALLTLLFAVWMSQIVESAERKLVSLEKKLETAEFVQTEEERKLVITAEVNVAGRVVEADEYSFTLKDEDGKKIATQKCDDKGLIKFEVTDIDGAGDYVFTVSENMGNLLDVVYDERVFTVELELEKEDDTFAVKSPKVTVDGEKADGVRFLNEFREPVIEAFWAVLMFGLICVFGPAAALAHRIIHRRLRRASLVVTESHLICCYGKRKNLDISLKQVKNLRLGSDYMESISFVYAGKARTVRFIQNRQDVFGVIGRQKQAILDAESEERA